jgi:hypothetical protein
MNYGKGYKMTFKSISFISLMVLVSGCSSTSGIKKAPETYFKDGQNSMPGANTKMPLRNGKR